jgi:hypothetical protein
VFILYSQLLNFEQIVVKISNSYGTGTLTTTVTLELGTSAHVNFLLQQLGKITFS